MTGNIFIAGITFATELKVSGATKSVFIAMFDGVKYVWIKVINYKDIDTFEFMSVMGRTSQNLILYVTESNNPYKPIIFTISKIDGSKV